MRFSNAPVPPAGRIAEIWDGLIRMLAGPREISRGLHPTILTEGGLELALEALAWCSAMPAVQTERRPPEPVGMAGVLHGVGGADERRTSAFSSTAKSTSQS